MSRKLLVGGLALLLLASFAAPAFSQGTGGAVQVSLSHFYAINRYGFGVLNETLTFHNGGNATAALPQVQVGIPDAIASRSPGFVLTNANFSMSRSESGGAAVFTISGPQALAPGQNISVSLKSYLSGVLNITGPSTRTIGALILLSPSLNVPASSERLYVQFPASTAIKPTPAGFSSGNNNTIPYLLKTGNDVTPSISLQNVTFTGSNPASLDPLQVYSITRTILSSNNGTPQIRDFISIRNLANYTVSNLKLNPIVKNLTAFTIVPSSAPPLINPGTVNLVNGLLTFSQTPLGVGISAGDNLTLSMLYNVPSSMVKTSGDVVQVSVPYALPLDVVAQNYTIRLSLSKGMTAIEGGSIGLKDATPLTQGTANFSYSLNLGWAADEGMPVAAMIFAVSFVALAFRNTRGEEEEEDESATGRFSDTIKAFEDRLALVNSSVEELSTKSPGSIGKAEFDRIRTELDMLRSRALQRLNETKQGATTARFVGLLGQLQEAAREEDRAAKDLLNLYEQFYGRKMKEETFQRLLPTYRKRVATAMNHLSDLLNTAQREDKAA